MGKMKCVTCGNLFRVVGKFVPPCPHCKGTIKEKPKPTRRSANNK